MAQLFSSVSLQHSSHISKLKKDPDFQYMHFWIDQIDHEMAPAGISPMPQPLPQQQPSTINSIPSRPLPDDKPFHFIFLHHRENQTCQVTARHVGIGAGGSETPQDITWQRCFKRSHQWGQVYKVQNDQKEESYLLDPRIFPRCANKWVREVGATRLCCQFFLSMVKTYDPKHKEVMLRISNFWW